MRPPKKQKKRRKKRKAKSSEASMQRSGRQLTVAGNVDRKGEVKCDVTFTQPAIFGGAASATAQVSSSVNKTHEFLLQLSSPSLWGRSCLWNLEASKATSDETRTSSYVEEVWHLVGKMTDPTGRHSLAAEAALRDVVPTGGSMYPSLAVQQSILQSVKTSLRYAFARSWQPSFVGWAADLFPMGTTIASRLGLEVALPPGSSSFLRCEAHGWATCRLPLGWTGSLSLCGGVLAPFFRQVSCLQDRFYLGGATAAVSMLKGFNEKGAGPMAPRLPGEGEHHGRTVDALGGEAVLSLHARVSTPLNLEMVSNVADQRAKSAGAQIFFFAGAGALARHASVAPSKLVAQLLEGRRAAVGAGVSLPAGPFGDVELTFAVPVRRKADDVLQPWQVGFRVNIIG
mmetsp:Transcript_10440/g.18802  ORF Transcript_10440/g.18802 Transcript_10440/m.18802 type:complete len:399 (+) Transcript_10440:60-1256(+)